MLDPGNNKPVQDVDQCAISVSCDNRKMWSLSLKFNSSLLMHSFIFINYIGAPYLKHFVIL